MTLPNARFDRYWERFLSSLPDDAPRPASYVEAFWFGTRPEGAADIAALVIAGVKTATGCPLWSYRADGKPVPEPGDHWIVTDGADDPLCVIRTIRVEVIPFEQVDEEWAWAGGEEDRRLASWRRMYWSYIESECARIGRVPTPEAPLVMEQFELVYALPAEPREPPTG